MIYFKYVEWTNFLNTGNTTVRMYLNKAATTLIRGENGSGKTLALDAICYALFNKPLRDVKLGQLVNSVNGKKMVVRIVFEIHGIEYEIARGQKPGIFEFIINGELQNKDAGARDVQSRIESVLGCDHKSFTQVVLMASTGYTYFLELSMADRRAVVERMLDIEVIGKMSELMKLRTKSVMVRSAKSELDIERIKMSIDAQKTIVDGLTSVSQHQITAAEESIADLTSLVDAARATHLKLKDNIPVLPIEPEYPKLGKLADSPLMSDCPDLPPEPEITVSELPQLPTLPPECEIVDEHAIQDANNDVRDVKNKIDGVMAKAKELQLTAKFYTDNTKCETCQQEIDHDHSCKIVGDVNGKLNFLRAEWADYNNHLGQLESYVATLIKQRSAHQEWVNITGSIVSAHKSECDSIENNDRVYNASEHTGWRTECDAIKRNWKSNNDGRMREVNMANTTIVDNHKFECQLLKNKWDGECRGITREYDNQIAILVNEGSVLLKQLNAQNEAYNTLMNEQMANNESHHDALKSLVYDLTGALKISAEIHEDMELCTIGTKMLKEDGLKSKIIKQYLPMINHSINDYLDKMGANYSFVLDENFNETIKSRYRDKFSYGSFSNGQRSRINMAILLMWRKLAESKNTVSSNLLFIDEVLDSSLDTSGIESVMNVFSTMKNQNICVISHRNEIVDYFDAHIQVSTKGNFGHYEFG